MKRGPISAWSHEKRDDTICRLVRDRIHGGVYQAGDKISSVREMAQQQMVSVATVLEAYRRLEVEGVIRSQPQSGFYVQLMASRKMIQVPVSEPHRTPMEPTQESIVSSVLHDARGENVVHLAGASPNIRLLPIKSLSKFMARALREETVASMSYASPLGVRSLREQISKKMLSASVTCSPEEVIVTNGGSESLALCIGAVCKRGDIIAVESPTYYAMLLAAKSLGVRVIEVATHPTDGISLTALRTILEQYPIKAVVLTPSHGNPLGQLMPEENKAELVQLLEDSNVTLIEDDVYGDLGYALHRPPAAKAYDRTGNVLYCSSFSKTLAPGFRVGWIVAGSHLHKIELLKFATAGSTATPQQLALADFLAFQRYNFQVRKAIKVYHASANLMASAVRQYFPDGTHVQKPLGGFVIWVSMPKEVNSIELYRAAIQENITLMPGPAFSAHNDRFANCMRLNCSHWNSEVEGAIKQIGRLVKYQMELNADRKLAVNLA